MTARTAQILRWALRIAITVLFAVMVNRGITRDQFRLIGEHLSPVLLGGAILSGLLSLFFQLLRWHMVLGIQNFSVTLYRSFATFVWGNLLAFITPGRVGEFGRALALDPRRKADAVLSVAIDKVAAVLATVLFGLLGIGVQLVLLHKRPPDRLTICVAGFLVVVPLVTAWIMLFSGNQSGRSGRIGTLMMRLRKLTLAVPRFFTGKIVGASLCAQAALLVQTSLILSMFSNTSFLENMALAAQVYAFMLFLPFFIANIGLREYSFAMMFENMDIRFTGTLDAGGVVLWVSLLILLLNIILPAVAGLAVMLIDKKHGSTV